MEYRYKAPQEYYMPMSIGPGSIPRTALFELEKDYRLKKREMSSKEREILGEMLESGRELRCPEL